LSDQGAASEAAKAIGDPFGTLGSVLAGFVPEGPLRTVVLIVEGLCVSAAYVGYNYYIGLLANGGAEPGSIERQDYIGLRASLEGGNLAARLYAKWLTAFLDGIERFFGDAGIKGQRAFGLKKAAPLWTAPAFDCCLLLALIYPIATIFAIWAISGFVGPAEAALGLKPDISGWARGILAGSIVVLLCSNLAWWRRFTVLTEDARWERKFPGLVFGFVFAGFAAGAAVASYENIRIFFAIVLINFTMFTAIPFIGAGMLVDVGGFIGVGAVYVAFAAAVVLAITASFPIVVGLFGPGAGAVVLLGRAAIRHRWRGLFLSLFLLATIVACLAVAALPWPQRSWGIGGPLVLFLGLLTLLNAPFDWASLGLTRALLRRGLEREKWWPYGYALLDAAFASGIVVALALVMVVGVQAFDELAAHARSKPILLVRDLFAGSEAHGGGKAVLPSKSASSGITTHPKAPEYWWVYALLLSSMIPSIINLAIGGMAFTRGIPRLSRLLLQWIPAERAVPENNGSSWP